MNSFSKIKSFAKGSWGTILSRAGIPSVYLSRRHGPCPICGGKDRFRFDDKGGDGSFICNRCGAGDGFQLLQLYLGCSASDSLSIVQSLFYGTCISYGRQPAKPAISTPAKSLDQSRFRKVWEASRTISQGDPVHVYLTQERNLHFDKIPCALRYAPELYEPETKIKMPAMVARVEDSKGQVVGIHRTYIKKDGRKASLQSSKKLMKGSAIKGAAIKLFRPDSEYLGIAEGIETAIACQMLFRVPTWACISSSTMHSVVVPKNIEKIIVFGDNDFNGVGQKAAAKLAERLTWEGKKARLMIPPSPGTDWADSIQTEYENDVSRTN